MANVPGQKEILSPNPHSGLFLGVLVLSCTIIFPNVLDITLVPRFFILSIGLLILAIGILYKMREITFRLDYLQSSFILYLGITFLSCFWAFNKSEAIFENGKVVLAVIVFFLTYYALGKDQRLEIRIAKVITCISFLYSMVAIVQLLKVKNFDYENLYAVNSLAGHKNLLSAFLFLSIPYSIFSILNTEGLWKKVSQVTLVLVISLLFLLQTRSVWVALFFSILLFIILIVPKFRSIVKFIHLKYLLSGFALITVVVLTFILSTDQNSLYAFKERLDITQFVNSGSAIERFALWEKTILLAKEYFPFGAGPGNWQILYTKFSVDGITGILKHNQTFQRPHNDFLWVITETGIVGIFFYLSILIVPVYFGIKIFISKKITKETLSILIYSLTIVGFLVISFFDFPKERIELLVIVNILIATLYYKIMIATPLKKVYGFNIKSTYLLAGCFIFLSSNLIIAAARLNGEHSMKKVYAYRAKGKWPLVLKYCNKAQSPLYTVDPTTIPISWYKGVAYFSTKNYESALSEYSEAHRITPYNHYILNDLGSVSEILGKHENAKNFYLESLRIHKGFDDPKLNLAAVYYNEKNYKEAWKWTNQVSESNNRKQLFLNTIKPFIEP